MINRFGAGWQLILADLALILFLVTLAALAESLDADKALDGETTRLSLGTEAPVQAVYRAGPEVMPFANWLASQPSDPRVSLTIYARYTPEDEATIWQQTRAMASAASDYQFRFRVVVSAGTSSDISASLAYDLPSEAQTRVR